jgi:putative DNA primase/helicase
MNAIAPSLGGLERVADRPPAFSDEALALRFAERHVDDLRYVAAWRKWLSWDGACWRPDETLHAFDLARRICREAAAECNKPKIAAAIASAKIVAAVERLARADRRMAATIDQWNRDPFLCGTPDGTLDLRSGRVRSSDSEDYISKLIAVAPADVADAATCPLWLKFIEEISGGDAGYARFLQQWSGYNLTGDTREECLVFAFGDGQNGKGVFIRTISGLAGEYAHTAAIDLFIASRSDKHTTSVAALHGKRCVVASETESNRTWAIVLIKNLTGRDNITARFTHKDDFTFEPTLKLTIISNYNPNLPSVEDAEKRRFNIAPFDFKPTKPDQNLSAKLRGEWPGILRWMIDGALDWQRNGLTRPAVVVDATADYFAEQDTFSEWINDACTVEPKNDNRKETFTHLFQSWAAFAKARGVEIGSPTDLSSKLDRLGLRKAKNVPTGVGSKRGRGFIGISMLRPTETD